MASVEAKQLELILQLTDAARRAERSSLWKTDIDAAIDAHGDACDALWSQLYALLDERRGGGAPLPKLEPVENVRKAIKKEIYREMKEELPHLVKSLLEEI